jgi:hypothetical protein
MALGSAGVTLSAYRYYYSMDMLRGFEYNFEESEVGARRHRLIIQVRRRSKAQRGHA